MIDYNEIDRMTSAELVELYASIIRSAKKRNLIRTKNFIGEIGESVVIDYYCNTPGLPNLLPAPVGTENIDAISRNGERYRSCSISTSRRKCLRTLCNTREGVAGGFVHQRAFQLVALGGI